MHRSIPKAGMTLEAAFGGNKAGKDCNLKVATSSRGTGTGPIVAEVHQENGFARLVGFNGCLLGLSFPRDRA